MTQLFLSRLALNPRSRRVARELENPYELHRTISKAFAPAGSSAEEGRKSLEQARILFRVDTGRQPFSAVALVQSKAAPEWRWLNDRDDLLLAEPQVRPFEASFQPLQRLAFRLRVNPTVKRNGKRLGLYTEKDRMEWLNRKSQTAGVRILHLTSSRDAGFQTSQRSGVSVSHSAVQFDGVLHVLDGGLLAQAVASGVGSGKAFGFGLLSLRPL